MNVWDWLQYVLSMKQMSWLQFVTSMTWMSETDNNICCRWHKYLILTTICAVHDMRLTTNICCKWHKNLILTTICAVNNMSVSDLLQNVLSIIWMSRLTTECSVHDMHIYLRLITICAVHEANVLTTICAVLEANVLTTICAVHDMNVSDWQPYML